MIFLSALTFVSVFMVLVGFAIDRFKPMASGPYCITVMLAMAAIYSSIPTTNDFGFTVLIFFGMLIAEAATFGAGIELNRWLWRRARRREQREFEEEFQNDAA